MSICARKGTCTTLSKNRRLRTVSQFPSRSGQPGVKTFLMVTQTRLRKRIENTLRPSTSMQGRRSIVCTIKRQGCGGRSRRNLASEGAFAWDHPTDPHRMLSCNICDTDAGEQGRCHAADQHAGRRPLCRRADLWVDENAAGVQGTAARSLDTIWKGVV